MDEDHEKIAESAWQEAFRQRLKEVQGTRTQAGMAEILGISRDTWNKVVNRGDAPSIRLLPKLATIGEKSLEWLITGKEKKAATRRKTPAREKQRKLRS